MLATAKPGITPAIAGIDQQNFDEIQLLAGAYPYQKGLQQRIPGKSLSEVISGPIGAIEVFYNVLGRPYTLIGYDGNISIEPINLPPWSIPALPPVGNSWFDDFSGYSPSGLVAFLWGAGVWMSTVGVCQSIIDGWFDPFLVYANVYAGGINFDSSKQPVALPPPSTDPGTTPLSPTDPQFQYPVHPPDLYLNIVEGHADNSCQGQGTQPVFSIDFINYHAFPTAAVTGILTASSITPGTIFPWFTLRVGRLADVDIGLVQGDCPGPSMPPPVSYFYYANSGDFGNGT